MVAALISRSPSRRLDTLGGLTRLSLLDFMEWMWHSHLGSPDSLVRLAVIHCLHEKQHSVPCSQNSTDYRHFSYEVMFQVLFPLTVTVTVTVTEKLCVVLCDCRRPIPGREFVEVYIKAYYLPETQLETWIYDHKVR